MPATISADEIPADLSRQLGLPRQHTGHGKPARYGHGPRLDKERVRSFALKCLAVLTDLTRAEGARVLSHAEKVTRL
jgi:hypothetical protein